MVHIWKQNTDYFKSTTFDGATSQSYQTTAHSARMQEGLPNRTTISSEKTIKEVLGQQAEIASKVCEYINQESMGIMIFCLDVDNQ